jgi:hypothetical protein
MQETFYHGSAVCIDGPLQKGTCVSSDKCNALIFARRRQQGDCYIYELLLDPVLDLRQQEDGGILDQVLIRDTPFSKRILATDDLIAECKKSLQNSIA